jgi:multidrug efflux pump subunit AcrB
MERPQVREVVGREEMIRLAVHGDVAERELKRMAEGFRDELALLPGVSLVQLFGVRREEVSIELSREAMQRYGIGFDEVAAAVRGSSINLSSGVVRTETGDMQLRARNLADSAADFDRIVVRQVADGGTVRLADVAKVVDGFEDNEIRATLNGEQAVLLQVMSTDRMDVVKASESVNAWLEGARARLPKGMSLTMWWDSAEMYRDRMDTILGSALSGLALVFGVLMLSLRPKVALWVTAGIATAYIGTFALLPGMDVSINIMSTFAFMLVLGIVVDDAIVIGENIHTVNDEGRASGTAAAILGAQAVAKPVLYAVATTIIAFLPWFFLSGPEAQITRQISIVIVCALTISLMEAWFVLPAHLRHLPPRRDRNRLAQLQHGIESALGRFADTRYRAWLGAALERRWIVLCGFLAFFILSTGLLSSGWLKFTFMPDIEGDQLIVNVELPEGTPYSRALAILAQLQDAERRLEDEVNANGEGKRLIETWYTRSRRDSVIAIVKLVPPEERALSSKQAAERLRELLGEVPDAEAIQVLHSMGSTDPDMEYSVSHPDNEVLKHAVDALRERLAQYDNTYDVRDSLQDSTEELRLHLLPGAERMGLSLAEVSRQVRQAYYGQEVQRLPRDGNDVKVMVRYPRESRQNLHSLEQFRLRTADGREVPLLAVAEIEYRPGVQRLERRERQRSVVVSAELRDDVRHRIDEDLAKNFFPQWRKDFPGVTLGAVGAAEGEAEFMQEVTSLYAVALFVMYALIAVAFRSYWQPVIVMSAIPFGFMGAVYGHMLIDMPMALFSYFGIGAAAGVVVNDNLVLMDRINQLREEGLGPREALLEAGASRFRPILLTSVTTFVGLVPMMAAQSMQAQFLQPTVVSLAFGVLFATFVTLFFVPALYLVGENARARAARRRARAPLPRGAGVAEAG